LFFSALSTWLITGLIKILTAIGRPITLNPMIIEKSFSFPSGHSSVMMTVAVVAYSLNKKLGIFLFIMAILVGFSRIILGVHFPIDVLIGWLLGGVVGYIFIRIFKKI
jgi:undecaprenyl-diphosphatase